MNLLGTLRKPAAVALLALALTAPCAAFADEAQPADGAGQVAAATLAEPASEAASAAKADGAASGSAAKAEEPAPDQAAKPSGSAADAGSAISDDAAAGDGSSGVTDPGKPDAASDASDGATAEPSDAAAAPVAAETAQQPQAAAEPRAAAKSGWVQDADGVRYYGKDGKARTGWLVDSTYRNYGLQRYWLGKDGVLSVSELISAKEAGWWAYATRFGYVVRGRYVDPSTGNVYFADNDGRLAGTGWVVSRAYGQGLQRYWIDPELHAAVPGRSKAGWDHYTVSAGYVLRGATSEGGHMRWADNDGRLKSDGWLVTRDFGQGLQRYWMQNGEAAKSRLVDAGRGYLAYARPEGYVVRGAYASGSLVYLADNDGRLAPSGWVVSKAFGQGLQRYWIDGTKHAAVKGYSTEGWAHWTTSQGFVARGAYRDSNGKVYLANNDGLLSGSGWIISRAYGQGLQRYWVDASSHACAKGFFKVDGKWYYGRSEGYVLRGKMRVGGGMLLADNDGLLAENSAKEGWLVTSAYDGHLERYRIDYSCQGHLGAHLGKFSLGGKSYYGRYDQGYVVRNTIYKAPDGKSYYGNNDGVLQSIPVRFADMLSRAQGIASRTGWLIIVDTHQNRIAIYSGKKGSWNAKTEAYCVTGAPSTPTIKGQFETTGGHRMSLSTDSRARWCTQINGGYFFHTILASTNELGHNLSHGCVRLAPSNAQWIYQNIPTRTKVYIY